MLLTRSRLRVAPAATCHVLGVGGGPAPGGSNIMFKHARMRSLLRPLSAILGLVLVTGAWLAVSGPTTAAPREGSSPIVAKSDEGKAKSRVSGTTEDGRRVTGTFTPS